MRMVVGVRGGGVIFGIDDKCIANIMEKIINSWTLSSPKLRCIVLSLCVVVARLCSVSARGHCANQCVVVCECK